jgi:hypothetical protein
MTSWRTTSRFGTDRCERLRRAPPGIGSSPIDGSNVRFFSMLLKAHLFRRFLQAMSGSGARGGRRGGRGGFAAGRSRGRGRGSGLLGAALGSAAASRGMRSRGQGAGSSRPIAPASRGRGSARGGRF